MKESQELIHRYEMLRKGEKMHTVRSNEMKIFMEKGMLGWMSAWKNLHLEEPLPIPNKSTFIEHEKKEQLLLNETVSIMAFMIQTKLTEAYNELFGASKSIQ